MIAFVSGTVAGLAADGVVVDVGGVGLSVQCTPGTIASLRLGAPARLPTSLIVREESLTLYGFADDDERDVFEILQTASGVGPRLAQAVLAVHSPDEVRRAVTSADESALMQVPGIGRKGAQRIILELRDRIGYPSGPAASSEPVVSAATAWRDPVTEGLMSLGWSAKEAERAVETLANERAEVTSTDHPDIADLLRAALRLLSRS